MTEEKNRREEAGYTVSLKNILNDWPALVPWLVFFLGGLLQYPRLPDQVPSHWNIYGQVDAYSSKGFMVLFFPALTLAVYLGMLFMPLIDPRRANYAKFADSYRLLRLALVLFMVGLYGVTLTAALGYPLRVDRLVTITISILFIVIGNLFGKVKHNYFVGIRTPWTLASETVWRKTHRVSGYVWVVGGLISLLSSFMPAPYNFIFFFVVTLGMTLFSIVYSYIAYRQEQEQGG